APVLLVVTATPCQTASMRASLETTDPRRPSNSRSTPIWRSGIDSTSPARESRRLAASTTMSPNEYWTTGVPFESILHQTFEELAMAFSKSKVKDQRSHVKDQEVSKVGG